VLYSILTSSYYHRTIPFILLPSNINEKWVGHDWWYNEKFLDDVGASRKEKESFFLHRHMFFLHFYIFYNFSKSLFWKDSFTLMTINIHVWKNKMEMVLFESCFWIQKKARLSYFEIYFDFQNDTIRKLFLNLKTENCHYGNSFWKVSNNFRVVFSRNCFQIPKTVFGNHRFKNLFKNLLSSLQNTNT